MKKRNTISLAVLTLLVVASAISTGCSKQTAKSTNDDGIVIGWLQKNATLTFETVINSGVVPYLAEAKKNGVIEDYITFDGNTDPAIQINQAYDLINLKVNAAIIQPAEADGSAPAVQALHEAGIPVIAVNSTTSNTSELAASFVGSNDVEAGEIMGRYILDTLGNTGAYCHLQGIIGTSSSIQRTEGIHNVMDKVSGWKMLDEQSGEWSGDKANRFTQDWIALYGRELKAIICDNDDMSVAAKLACIEAGRSDIVVIGVDAIDSALAMVKAGELDATVFQDGKGQGRSAAEAAVKAAKGEPVEKETWIPFVLVTKDNIDQYYKK